MSLGRKNGLMWRQQQTPRYTLPRVGGLLEKPLTSLQRLSPTAATVRLLFFELLFSSLVCQKPENPSWELLDVVVPTQLFWLLYSFGQPLVFGPCFFISFLTLLANGGETGKKVDFEGRLAWVLTVITNRTKLKNDTPNALSSPYSYADAFFFLEEVKFREIMII